MKIVIFANTDWYLYNFRRSFALALRDAGHDVLLISPEGLYGEKLRALGLRWQALSMERRSLNPVRELAVLWRLIRLFRRERPDLVHAFTIKCAIYGSLAARIARVPARVNAVAGMGYVFTSRDATARLLRPLVRKLMRTALGGSNARLILQNPDDVAVFQQARMADPASIRLIRGSGVDITRFYPASARASDRRVRVLLPARLLWDKGVAEYAEAGRILRARNVSVELLLAGNPDSGNPAAVPETTVLGWVDEGALRWLGHVDDMPGLMRDVDIVALPTSYGEGVPRGLIEAAASGCALIATDVPGCREVVVHEMDGLRIPVRNAGALADAIERLVVDVPLRTRLAVAAREKAVAEFDERIVIARTMEVYRELVADAA